MAITQGTKDVPPAKSNLLTHSEDEHLNIQEAAALGGGPLTLSQIDRFDEEELTQAEQAASMALMVKITTKLKQTLKMVERLKRRG